MGYKFGKTSLERMNGVHPLLIECAEKALSYGVLDLTIPQLGGMRTLENQRLLVASGASQTLSSMHRAQDSGYGHAIDLIPYPVNWSNTLHFAIAGTLMFRAASEIGIPLEWGGHWRTFKDYPHFQLPRDFTG